MRSLTKAVAALFSAALLSAASAHSERQAAPSVKKEPGTRIISTSGWIEVIPSEVFFAVTPTEDDFQALRQGGPRIDNVMGPKSVLSKWNGAAFDPETGRIYAHGGGHFDYAGNEVYMADIDAGTWERLTDPSPYIGELLATDADGDEYRLPIDGPISAHTYAGTVWNPDSKSFFRAGAMANATFNGIDIAYPNDYRMWEFHPAKGEWSVVDGVSALGGGAAVYVPMNKRVYVMTDYRQIIRDVDGSWHEGAGYAPKTKFAVAAYDHQREKVWTLHTRTGNLLVKWAPTEQGLTVEQTIALPVPVSDLLPGYDAVAVRKGLVWLYSGNELVTFDPESSEWLKYEPTGDTPRTGLVLNKFWYWPNRDVFVLTANDGAVWLLNPDGMNGTPIDPDAKKAEVNGKQYAVVQDAIDAAQPGDTVTILPGTYDTGIKVATDDLTIKADGVVIDAGIYGNKAWVVQKARNLTIEGIEAKNLRTSDGNGALVRMEPSASGLTLRNVYVHDSQGGCCVTGNRASGDVLIENSRFERVGHGGQAHGIYTGRNISKVIVRDSEFIGGQGGGHLIKSRAAYTEIVNTRIDSLDGNNSREIDIPEAGVLILDNVTVRKGPNAENNDIIGYAMETWRPWHAEQRVDIRNSNFTDDSGKGNAQLLHVGSKENPDRANPFVRFDNVTFNRTALPNREGPHSQ